MVEANIAWACRGGCWGPPAPRGSRRSRAGGPLWPRLAIPTLTVGGRCRLQPPLQLAAALRAFRSLRGATRAGCHLVAYPAGCPGGWAVRRSAGSRHATRRAEGELADRPAAFLRVIPPLRPMPRAPSPSHGACSFGSALLRPHRDSFTRLLQPRANDVEAKPSAWIHGN